MPVLPIALMFSGYSLAVIEDPGAGSPKYKGKEFSKKHNKCPPKMTVAILFLLVTNIPMALYMSLVHQVFSLLLQVLRLLFFLLLFVLPISVKI